MSSSPENAFPSDGEPSEGRGPGRAAVRVSPILLGAVHGEDWEGWTRGDAGSFISLAFPRSRGTDLLADGLMLGVLAAANAQPQSPLRQRPPRPSTTHTGQAAEAKSRCESADLVGGAKDPRDDKEPCVVCLTSAPEVCFSPCKHAVCCWACASRIPENCPLCRAKIDQETLIGADGEAPSAGPVGEAPSSPEEARDCEIYPCFHADPFNLLLRTLLARDPIAFGTLMAVAEQTRPARRNGAGAGPRNPPESGV